VAKGVPLAEDIGDPRPDADLDKLGALQQHGPQLTVEVHQLGHVIEPCPRLHLIKPGLTSRVCRVKQAERMKIPGEVVVPDGSKNPHRVGIVRADNAPRLEQGKLLCVGEVGLRVRHGRPRTN
jgi:hypothetical protein